MRPVDIDENPLPGEAPDLYVLRLARSKAEASVRHDGEVILTADTTVADGARILGKPNGAAEARQMLCDLRGREHTVYTAVSARGCLPGSTAEHFVSDLCVTQVWMRYYSDAEIDEYVASGDPFDKAGAYAIQHAGFHPVERIEGCIACVVGLPLCHAARALSAFGLTPLRAVVEICPEQLEASSPCEALENALRAGSAGR